MDREGKKATMKKVVSQNQRGETITRKGKSTD